MHMHTRRPTFLSHLEANAGVTGSAHSTQGSSSPNLGVVRYLTFHPGTHSDIGPSGGEQRRTALIYNDKMRIIGSREHPSVVRTFNARVVTCEEDISCQVRHM